MPIDEQFLDPDPDKNLCPFSDVVILRLVLFFAKTPERTQNRLAVQMLSSMLKTRATKVYYVEMRKKMQLAVQKLKEAYQLKQMQD